MIRTINIPRVVLPRFQRAYSTESTVLKIGLIPGDGIGREVIPVCYYYCCFAIFKNSTV